MMGALPSWTDPDDQLAALEALERDYYAASTIESVRAKLRTIARAHGRVVSTAVPTDLGHRPRIGRDTETGRLPVRGVVFVAL